MNGLDLLSNQKFVSVAELQAGAAKLLSLAEKTRSHYKVMRNNKPIGTLVPENVWDVLLLQLRLLSSKEVVANLNRLSYEKESEFLERIISSKKQNGSDS